MCPCSIELFFFFNDTATTEIYTLSLHDALPISGGGARRAWLEEYCRTEGIVTAEFRPYEKRSDLGRSLAEGHVGLVTQIPETIGAVVPSKTYGIMAAGRPMLYIGPQGATPARVLQQHQCGWRIEPGDAAGMIRLFKRPGPKWGLGAWAGEGGPPPPHKIIYNPPRPAALFSSSSPPS